MLSSAYFYTNYHLRQLVQANLTPSRLREGEIDLSHASISLHHVHGVLGEERVNLCERGPEFTVSVPAAQHQLVQALGTHRRPSQIHLIQRERERDGVLG